MNLSLIFSFMSDTEQLPPGIQERRVDGLLLHGSRPTPGLQTRLQSLPTVWLMANPQRPAWGDQVMPDNSAIGAMAAQYLLRRGHRQLAFLGTGASWAMEIRAMAFADTARDAGAQVQVIETSEQPGVDFWERDGLSKAADALARKLVESRNRPTGLFIAEDRLVPLVDAAMRLYAPHQANDRHQDHSRSVDIISCNNERNHFAGLKVLPATIDICADAIGRLGVAQLNWRLSRPGLPERIRCMVEPILVESESASMPSVRHNRNTAH